jgi:hypothetical protein
LTEPFDYRAPPMGDLGGSVSLPAMAIGHAAKATASTQCPHSDLDITVNNQAFVDSNQHYLEIKVSCKICGKPMVFKGMPFGVLPDRPTMSIDGQEIILPFLGEGEEPTGKVMGFVGKQVA